MTPAAPSPGPFIQLYTDGSTYPNPGPGGWGATVITPHRIVLLHGRHFGKTTNNAMELEAILQGLRAISKRFRVELFSDSQWSLGAIFNDHWRVTTNLERLSAIKEEIKKFELVRPAHVKGHADDEYNNLCDRLAGSGYQGLPRQTHLNGRELVLVTFLDRGEKPQPPHTPNHTILKFGQAVCLE